MGPGPPPRPRWQLRPPPQVAGTWHSMAMAASDISLLDSETAPLRVYVQELRPTPRDNLEIILRKWWVTEAPGLGAGEGLGPGWAGWRAGS